MTESVFRNCLKWMQKNLEWQCTARGMSRPRAYVARLPGIKDIAHGLKAKAAAIQAIRSAAPESLSSFRRASPGRWSRCQR